MRKATLIVLVLFFWVGGICIAGKGGKGKPNKNTVVVVTFRDAPGDGVQSDSQGPYLDGNGTTSHILENGNLIVDPTNDARNPARSFFYFFEDDPIVPYFLYDPDGLESFDGRFSGKCSGDGGMPGMVAGGQKDCKVNVKVLEYDGEAWRIDYIDDPDGFGNHTLLLSCVEGNSSSCWKWTYEGWTGVLVHTRLKGKNANVPVPVGVVSMPLFFTVCDPALAPGGCG